MKVRLKYMLYMALFRPLSWLPLGVLYCISSMMRIVLQHLMHYRRKVVRRNLEECYPEKSTEELRRIETEFYRQLTDNMVETIKLLHISDRQMRQRNVTLGTEHVTEAARQNRPIILFLGHYCNWEWVPSVTLYYDEPRVSGQLYKPLHDKAFDRVMLRVRSRFHSLNIDIANAFRRLLTMRRDDGTFMVGFIADHRTSWRETRHHAMFMRHLTWFYPGGEEIGRRIDAVYLYLDVEKLSRGHYRYTFRPIVPDPDVADYPVTRKYLEMMQATIDRAPAYWLWSHRRWPKSETQAARSNENKENNDISTPTSQTKQS